MSRVISGMAERQRMMIGLSTLLIFACAVLAPTLVAQRQGPLPPPPGTVAPSSAPADSAKTNAPRQATSSHITNDPPALPVEQIIQKFTEHEESHDQ